MTEEKSKAPKAFLSYSWTSEEHRLWVLNLATNLREAGVDVVLDVWDLKEGDESGAFMESMVTDPDMEKVIIVSDRAYAEKSDNRKGGAGVEAQIISKEIFDAQDREKFAVLVTETDDNGRPCVPAYYTSRIFIDYTDRTKEAESFEQLLRWIFGKPMHKKPKLGTAPSYLFENENTVTLPTMATLRRAINAIENDKKHALAATQDFLELFTREMEAFRLPADVDILGDDYLAYFENFTPYRNQIIELLRVISRYTNQEQFGEQIHRFFERLLGYCTGKHSQDSTVDNFKFFTLELFLYACATFLDDNRADLFKMMLEKPYFDKSRSENEGRSLVKYDQFRQPLRSLHERNDRLELLRMSLRSDLMHKNATQSGYDFSSIVEVDFIIFLRAEMTPNNEYHGWYPETLAYADGRHHPFEHFARAQSKAEFDKLCPYLGITSKDTLDILVSKLSAGENKFPYRRDGWIRPKSLMGYDNLCTMP